MAQGTIYWYRLPMSEAEVSAQIAFFRENGYSLTNPGTGKVIRLGPEGERIETAVAPLQADIATVDEVITQFWLRRDTDLVCTFRRISSQLQVQLYSLAGFGEDRDSHATLLWSAFRRNLAVSQALIIDRYGRAEDMDWNEVALTGSVSGLTVLPSLMAVRQEPADRLRPDADSNSFMLVGLGPDD
ncbi:MAG: hypothetical protein M3024_08355 [Candidatus Dormibacteraeota bacterium]|nr:hypothetical protein [Candidatus Dormibacteraeota bacterium]